MCRQERYQEIVVNEDRPERSATVFHRTGRNRARPADPCVVAVNAATVTAPNAPRQAIAHATPDARMAHFAAMSPMVRIRYDIATNRMPCTVSAALSVRGRTGAWADMLAFSGRLTLDRRCLPVMAQ